MHILTKKRALGALATLAVLAVAGVAFAFFTSQGTGEGTATVASTGAKDIEVTSITTGGSLYPLVSEPAPNTTITLTNKGTGVEYVKDVTVKEITVDGSHPTCKAAEWFEFTGTGWTGKKVTVDKQVVPGTPLVLSTHKASLWLKNVEAPQTGCEGAEVIVQYESN
jgi:hypothetical protein